MKNFQNYIESPYFDMKSPFGFPNDCSCNPCHRFPPTPRCPRPIRRPPENCIPPKHFCPPSCDNDELLFLLTGILIGRRW